MKLSEQVKPMSYLKAHAPEIIRTLGDNRQPVVITVHGEAKAVLQDVAQYEETQETLALLKVLALTGKQVEEGRVRPAAEAFAHIRKRVSGEPSGCHIGFSLRRTRNGISRTFTASSPGVTEPKRLTAFWAK